MIFFLGVIIILNAIFIKMDFEIKIIVIIFGLILLIIGRIKIGKEIKIEKNDKDKYLNNMKIQAEKGDANAHRVLWQQNREIALKRAGHRCENCGAMYELHVHHVRPKKIGGNDNQDNLKVLCKNCHEELHGYKITDHDEYDEHRIYKNEKVNKIKKVILSEKNLKFSYKKPNGEVSLRFVKPKEMYVENRKQYLLAYDFKRNDNRNFRISRMSNLLEVDA